MDLGRFPVDEPNRMGYLNLMTTTTKTVKTFKCRALATWARKAIRCLGVATKTVWIPGALTGRDLVGKCSRCSDWSRDLEIVTVSPDCRVSRAQLLDAVMSGAWSPEWLAAEIAGE